VAWIFCPILNEFDPAHEIRPPVWAVRASELKVENVFGHSIVPYKKLMLSPFRERLDEVLYMTPVEAANSAHDVDGRSSEVVRKLGTNLAVHLRQCQGTNERWSIKIGWTFLYEKSFWSLGVG
jgi:hypothetical protein